MSALPNQSRPTEFTTRMRTCQECGMLLDHPGEFHPLAFCTLKKAGYDPWETFAWCVKGLTGTDLPDKPPLIRDLPLDLSRGSR